MNIIWEYCSDGGWALKKKNMFENAINSKKQGDMGMCYAMAYFSKIGYTVSVPITDSQDYDLIVDNGALLKVQVKTTKCISKFGIYQVALKTCGGNRSGQTIKGFNENSSDLLFILVDNNNMYLIPRSEITNNAAINLGKEYDRYKVYL